MNHEYCIKNKNHDIIKSVHSPHNDDMKKSIKKNKKKIIDSINTSSLDW